jgi:hypothetical protein
MKAMLIAGGIFSVEVCNKNKSQQERLTSIFFWQWITISTV